MKTLVIIPARLSATRLPRKPLADIHGKPMVVHAFESAKAADVGDVLVACCNKEIATVVEAYGGKAILTDPNIPSGSDRVYQAFLSYGQQADVIINLQGDLPFFPPSFLKEILLPLQEAPHLDIATLAFPIPSESDVHNPNLVKVVMSPQSHFYEALYFSRQAVPHQASTYFGHVGIYAYRRQALEKFVQCIPSSLEKIEKLEQLRALENGLKIGVSLVNEAPLSVDTLEDLEQLRQSIIGKK